MEKTSHSESETAAIAAQIAPDLKPGDIVCLHGTLGMGKTVFSRALIRALTGRADLDVPSPTFTLLQTYDTPNATLYHFDLYRIEDPEEIFEIGWEDAISSGITLVEWPERLGPYMPARRLDITLRASENNPNTRVILIERPD